MKVTFVGDIMLEKESLNAYRNGDKYDFSEMFEKIKKLFSESDLILGNLETPITKNKEKLTNKEFRFSSPIEFAKAVYNVGIKYVSTANNHCLDNGIEGINETIECLNEIGFSHTGTFKNRKDKKYILENKDGIKIAILSYTYGTNAFSNNIYLNRKNEYHVNLFQNQELSNRLTRYCRYHNNMVAKIYNKINKSIFKFNAIVEPYERKEFCIRQKIKLKRNIKKCKKDGANLIIMLAHMGGQYNKEPTRLTREISEFLMKSGVNIIVGNHEHVVHEGDFSKIDEGKVITYSLGNFTGTVGVYKKPFDSMSEYSIACNIYIDNTNITITKITFSVLKIIKTDNGGIQVVPAIDLLNEELHEKQQEELKKEILKIAYKFSKKKYDKVEEEFII